MILLLVSLVLVLILGLCYRLYIKKCTISNSKGLNPFYSTWKYTQRDLLLRETMAHFNIHQGFVHTWLGHRFSMSAVDADTAQFVLKHPDILKLNNFVSPLVRKTFGRNLLFANGEDWRRHRALVNKAFNDDAYAAYYPAFLDLTDRLIAQLSALPGADLDCHAWYSKLTLDVLGRTIFNYDFQNLSSSRNDPYEAYRTVLSFGGFSHMLLLLLCPSLEALPLPGSVRVKRATGKLVRFFEGLVEEKRERRMSWTGWWRGLRRGGS
eukprot:TRINITY_DN6824_c0_g2_i1.p1 TRINITY_DN6824_c0_g2~~TRINITY_DN6824_c0_g2_i1.p1  ORF type:complete len:266 (-),score=47.11 TRINITY_DN6824_c0_g2_i1:736-1533(-)